MQDEPVKYNVALAKGNGLQDESLALLRLWQTGMSAQQLKNEAVNQGILGRATEKRTRDIITTHFAPRFLINNAAPAKQIKILLENHVSAHSLNQIIFLHTARANPILYDFITKVYWPFYEGGKLTISVDDAQMFIEKAHEQGMLRKKWSQNIKDRISRGLVRTLADFQLAENGRKSERKIQTFHINKSTLYYLIFDLHFTGYGDTALIEHQDWRLFGFEPMDVVRECQRVSGDYFILQYSGEFARFSWNFSNREEAFRVISEREF